MLYNLVKLPIPAIQHQQNRIFSKRKRGKRKQRQSVAHRKTKGNGI